MKCYARLDIRWSTNKKVLQQYIKKSCDEGSKPYLYNEENIDFALSLYELTAKNAIHYDKYISKELKNWNIKRLSDIDRIILQMGIVEGVHFPYIPIKVSINEYIEIAKIYATPDSYAFINGVLHNILESLKYGDKVEKIGKGLL